MALLVTPDMKAMVDAHIKAIRSAPLACNNLTPSDRERMRRFVFALVPHF
jgi:hypothetical protein